MKKLMIAAVIVCAATANVYGITSEFIFGSNSIPDAQGDMYSGSMTISCEALGYSTTFAANNGKFSFSDPISCTLDTEYTFALTATTSTHTYLETTTVIGDVSWVVCRFYGDGTWTAVPEPTSAMLMLLGMAGLALKRKRA